MEIQTKPFADHFSALAHAYASARPSYPAELFAYLASVAPARRHAWDSGAGNGQASVALAAFFEEVTATDASEAQLGAAPAHPRVGYRVAPAEASGLDAGSVDLVTAAQALHWFDIDAFFAEARRVLRPAGILAVWTYGQPRLDEAGADAVLAGFYTGVVGPYWPAERHLVETGYRTLSFPFDELTPPPFRMERRWTLAALLAYVRTWSATCRYIAERGADPVDGLARDLAAHWPEDRTETVRWPLSLRIGRRPG
jgi:SAM-dependent methyltransferase